MSRPHGRVLILKTIRGAVLVLSGLLDLAVSESTGSTWRSSLTTVAGVGCGDARACGTDLDKGRGLPLKLIFESDITCFRLSNLHWIYQ